MTADNNSFIYTSPSGSTTDIYSINSDGSNKIQLTENGGRDNTYPKASLDGRFIVFSSNRTGSNQIWRMNTDGSNQIQLTFGDNESTQAQTPAFSPDGNEVYFIRSDAESDEICKVPIAGGTPIEVATLIDAESKSLLSISPDGKWLAYHRIMEKSNPIEDESRMRIGLISLENQGETKQFDLPIRRPIIQWSSETTFDFAGGAFNSSALWRQSISGEKPEKLAEYPERIYNFALSKDGKKFAMSRGKLQGDAILITNLQ
jgi:Tol biopolymer transport system component